MRKREREEEEKEKDLPLQITAVGQPSELEIQIVQPSILPNKEFIKISAMLDFILICFFLNQFILKTIIKKKGKERKELGFHIINIEKSLINSNRI